MVSYLGMRLWVFVRHAQKEHLTFDKELGVHHLPRQAGHATGAHLRVILRAFRELFVHARKWHREEQEAVQAQVVNNQRGAKHHS